jgi:23S rRNA (uridine2552-2'-O)-methyltransferase
VLQGNFTSEAVQEGIREALGGRRADLVLSDLSPNLSGIASADEARAAELVRAAAAFCRGALEPTGGRFLCKLFQGGEFAGLLAELRRQFGRVQVLKPAASRRESRETYLLASGMTKS